MDERTSVGKTNTVGENTNGGNTNGGNANGGNTPEDSSGKESGGLRLLKKGQRGLVHALFGRTGIMILMLLLQAGLLFSAFHWFEEFLPHILGGTVLFTVCMVLYLINSGIDPTAKITWLIVIMLVPVFGVLLFWYTQSETGHRMVKQKLEKTLAQTRDKLPQEEAVLTALEQVDPNEASLARYIQRSGSFPVFSDTKVTYFPLGEDKFAEMLKQLKEAKKYIFMEYFIVEEGLMWGKILEILAQKAKEGVDVKFMYDGACEFALLPHNYPERLRALGIQCKMFAPVSPFLSTTYNYRDHRKILVIDGHTAFTGGVNLADEYINHVVKFGHWKDTAIMLKGSAAKSFALMFLQMWNIMEKNPEFDKYLDVPAPAGTAQDGYVIPFGDCPLDGDKVGERVYMDILNRSSRYVHIMTPYLILDGEMETALKFAAERGVDVKLILPGIPDKTVPYSLAKSHYKSLLASGVKIFEYTPGFVHAKVFVSDDCRGVVGTINLDYRSLYHHFECGSYLYRTACIADMEQDFQDTLKKCRQVSEETIYEGKRSLKPMGALMKIFAPLM